MKGSWDYINVLNVTPLVSVYYVHPDKFICPL